MPKDTDRIKLAETILGKPLAHVRLSLNSKTTTKEGKKAYQRIYMREKRRQERRRQGK